MSAGTELSLKRAAGALRQDLDILALPCSSSDLAALFGFKSARRIRQLVNEGAIEKSNDGFVLGAAVRSYCEYLRASKTPAVTSLEAERIRLVHAQADKAEIAVKVLNGDLIPAHAVLAAWSDILTIVKAAMLNLPNKLATRAAGLNDPAIVKDLMEREVKSALEELSNFDISACVDRSLPEGLEDDGAAEDTDCQRVGRR